MTGALQFRRHFDLARVGSNEQRDTNAGIAQPRDERPERIALTDHIEAAFGGDFRATLRNETCRMRFGRQHDLKHLGRGRHFKIERL